MTLDASSVTFALCQSLTDSNLLVGDLPEADAFAHNELQVPVEAPSLNLEQKLGHLSEDALALVLEVSSRYDQLARNLQIQKDAHTTVGELDFLIRDLDSGRLIHLELATKFYLAVQTESGLALPGPDARDNYARKLARLRKHQLRLPVLYQQHFPEAYRSEPIITQHLIHGCLFDHVDALELASADYLSPSCRRGRWLTIDQLSTHFPADTSYQVIPKPLWPVPPELLENIDLEPWSADSPIERCLMLRVSGESVPYFVVPSGYP